MNRRHNKKRRESAKHPASGAAPDWEPSANPPPADRDLPRSDARQLGEKLQLTNKEQETSKEELHTLNETWHTSEDSMRNHILRLGVLLEVSAQVLAARDLQSLLQTVADAARELTDARISTCGHGYVQGSFRVGAASCKKGYLPCPSREVFCTTKGGAYMDLIQEAESIRLTDIQMRSRADWWGLPEGHAPLRGLLGARLSDSTGNATGLIMVSDKEGGADFTREDEALLRQLAVNASLALQHVEAHKEAEDAAEKSRWLGRLPAENPNPVARVSADGTVLYSNPAAAAHPAWRCVVGQPLPQESLRRLVGQAIDSMQTVEQDLELDGTPFWVAVVPIPAECYVNIYGRDITARKQAEEETRRAESRWNAAIENLAEGAIIATEDEQVIYWNPAARAMHGFTSDQEGIGPLSRTPFTFQLWTPDGSRMLEIDEWPMRRIKRGETVRDLELRIRRPDQGWEKIFSYSGAMVDTAGGERLIFLSCYDLTGLRKAEEALTRSERRYRSFIEVTNHWAWVTDTNGLVVDDIPALRAFTGQTYEQAKGAGWADALHPDDIQRTLEVWKRAVATKTNYEIEYRMRRYDGMYRLLLARGVPILDDQGNVTEWVGTCTDITERKAAEEALQEHQQQLLVAEATKAERQRLYEVLETLPVYVVLLSKDYHVPFANRFFESRFGKSEGRRCYEYLFGAGEPCENCETYKVLKTGQPHHWYWTGPDKRDYDIYDFPFTDTDGSQMIMEMGIDITETKKAQAALREANEQLTRHAAQLRSLAGELTLSEQRERRRMARVLHDNLQQLLVGAKFLLTILGRHADSVVQQASKEVEQLLDDAIQASRSLTAELSPPILHDGGLNPGLEWLARWMADKHGLFVDLELESEAVPLAEDVKVLLFEGVRELLFNAVKHAQTKSAAVNVRRIGMEVQVVVSDQGIGFEPQAIQSAGEKGGGFGLFSIRERLSLIGGRLEISSFPGRGSRFVMTAPASPAPAHAPVQVSLVEAADEPVPPASTPLAEAKIRVLLADDHAVMREGLSKLLSPEPDIEVVGQAADGEEAVRLAAKLSPDVILMDLSLPKLNGVEATRAIHNDYPDIRIIGLSMFEEAERAQALRDAGAVDYLSKSGPSERLIAAIRRSMNARPERQPLPGRAPKTQRRFRPQK